MTPPLTPYTSGPPWPHWCPACRADTLAVQGPDGIWRCPGPHPEGPPEHLRLSEADRRMERGLPREPDPRTKGGGER